jgi:hypothetical protein
VPSIDYSEYFVAFIDVLGFKELVLSNKKEDKAKIEQYFELIEEVTKELERIKAKKHLGSLIISDSVILSIPIDVPLPDKIDRLRHLCVAIGKIQATLAKKNIWVRGAISSGLAFFDAQKQNVVGSAYVNAYLLEQRLAIYPRVILDHKIINELGKTSSQDLIEEINNPNDGGPPFTNWRGNILFNWKDTQENSTMLTQDIALFVDYLSPTISHPRELGVLINNIENKIYSDNNIYSKFRWTIDYLIVSCSCRMQYVGGEERRKLEEQFDRLRRY